MTDAFKVYYDNLPAEQKQVCEFFSVHLRYSFTFWLSQVWEDKSKASSWMKSVISVCRPHVVEYRWLDKYYKITA